jgi:hypothetical protein
MSCDFRTGVCESQCKIHRDQRFVLDSEDCAPFERAFITVRPRPPVGDALADLAVRHGAKHEEVQAALHALAEEYQHRPTP